ncbi:MAG: diadenylate cyclase CdaA [Bacteroidetes bacterium]|jgi:diadenylate cyclase|nr:diadenylate cyclase CdaA [Bacteroidota bacterium]
MELFRIGFISFNLIDLMDVSLVSFLFYRIHRALRNTMAIPLVSLLVLAFIFTQLVDLFNFSVMGRLFEEFLQLASIALMVIFAPELRRMALSLGQHSFFERFRRRFGEGLSGNLPYSEIIAAVEEMAESRTGAIIVLMGNTNLDSFIKTGDEINASVSKRLLLSIFHKNSPLHDGAVLLKDNTILAARVVLPVSDDPDIPPELGLRHRSALGISEITDAEAIVVSEETGKVSFASRGRLKRNLSAAELKQFMLDFHSDTGQTLV